VGLDCGSQDPRTPLGYAPATAYSVIIIIIIVELGQELVRRMTAVTEDTREATYLFQRMSVALQRGNAVSFHSTFTTE